MKRFLRLSRASFTYHKPLVRLVYISEASKEKDKLKLSHYVAERAPFFYRNYQDIIESFRDGFYLSAIKETLIKLPTSANFQESHFGEILASIFAEEVLGLKKLYSKLTLLTAENANAFKMDLVLYNPKSAPMEFVFAEVKSSPKTNVPADHHKACFPDLFSSFNDYSNDDLSFDIVAIKDNIKNLPPDEQKKIKDALKPYGDQKIKYSGFAVIDLKTKNDEEISLLGTRKNEKNFEVDVICVEDYLSVASDTYKKLEEMKKSCSQ